MTTTYEGMFPLEDVRAVGTGPTRAGPQPEATELEGYARIFNEIRDHDGGQEVIRSTALHRTVGAHRDGIEGRIWGEIGLLSLTPDGAGVLIRTTVGAERAGTLARQPLELVLRAQATKEQEVPAARDGAPPVREILELAIDSVEIRPTGPPPRGLGELEQDQRNRVHAYVQEDREGVVERVGDGS